MRPQRFSCGCHRAHGGHAARLHGFNEAAAIQLRMRSHTHAGRGLADASMRPQRFSCGCAIHSAMDAPPSAGFNEAAAIQLRMQRSGKYE